MLPRDIIHGMFLNTLDSLKNPNYDETSDIRVCKVSVGQLFCF